MIHASTFIYVEIHQLRIHFVYLKDAYVDAQLPRGPIVFDDIMSFDNLEGDKQIPPLDDLLADPDALTSPSAPGFTKFVATSDKHGFDVSLHSPRPKFSVGFRSMIESPQSQKEAPHSPRDLDMFNIDKELSLLATDSEPPLGLSNGSDREPVYRQVPVDSIDADEGFMQDSLEVGLYFSSITSPYVIMCFSF